jgi:hypothetical protein
MQASAMLNTDPKFWVGAIHELPLPKILDRDSRSLGSLNSNSHII